MDAGQAAERPSGGALSAVRNPAVSPARSQVNTQHPGQTGARSDLSGHCRNQELSRSGPVGAAGFSGFETINMRTVSCSVQAGSGNGATPIRQSGSCWHVISDQLPEQHGLFAASGTLSHVTAGSAEQRE